MNSHHLNKLRDSPKSMLYADVPDAGPLCPDVTADLPQF